MGILAAFQIVVDLFLGGLGFIAAAASAVAAFGAWKATSRATKAAEASTATAKTMARIEAQRRHDELAPVIEIVPIAPGEAGWFYLHNRSPREYVVDVTVSLPNGPSKHGSKTYTLPSRGFYWFDRPAFGLQGEDGVAAGLDVSWGQAWLELRYNLAPDEDPCPCGDTQKAWHWDDLHRQLPSG